MVLQTIRINSGGAWEASRCFGCTVLLRYSQTEWHTIRLRRVSSLNLTSLHMSLKIGAYRIISRLLYLAPRSAFWVPFASQLIESRASIRVTGVSTVQDMITPIVYAARNSLETLGAQERAFLVDVTKLYGTEFLCNE